jgi:hypothetical protein
MRSIVATGSVERRDSSTRVCVAVRFRVDARKTFVREVRSTFLVLNRNENERAACSVRSARDASHVCSMLSRSYRILRVERVTYARTCVTTSN